MEDYKFHTPVLLNEILDIFDPQPGQKFIDCTAGEGGHTIALAEMVKPNGRVLAIEYDPHYAEILKSNIEDRGVDELITVSSGSYTQIKEFAARHDIENPNGILFDFGLSSWQLERSGRGFTFRKDEMLDMRFNPDDETLAPAAEIINSSPQRHLEYIFKEYGEVRRAGKIAKAITTARKKERILTTGRLVEIIESVFPKKQRLHPATQIFQALRIAVNRELINVKEGLEAALEISGPGTKIAAISFHSLEDRIAKNFFREAEDNNRGKRINKKVIKPEQEEITKNPRARSAKLRVFKVV